MDKMFSEPMENEQKHVISKDGKNCVFSVGKIGDDMVVKIVAGGDMIHIDCMMKEIMMSMAKSISDLPDYSGVVVLFVEEGAKLRVR